MAGPTPDGWRVIDVWNSDEALERFRATLMPLLDEVGIPRIAPQVMPLHNLVTK
jgi:hypothetical protein